MSTGAIQRVAMLGEDIRRPGYLELFETGVLAERARILDESLRCCTLCPRRCGVDRKAGQTGFCGVGAEPRVAALSIHPWEEPPLSGSRGSGTVFFSGCTLKCRFCQNYPISQLGVGRGFSVEELAAGLMKLQKKGAHNINLVTPTHQVAAFVGGLLHAVPLGLNIPIVYNSSGYERLETLALLEGIVDIYLPDIKYADPQVAAYLSAAPDYVSVNRAALVEMWRQVGHLRTDADGLARRGMIVRHLVLPEDLSGTADNLDFLVRTLGTEVWVSLMCQYFPAHEAFGNPPLHRRVTEEEYDRAFRTMTELGILHGFTQEHPDEDALC